MATPTPFDDASQDIRAFLANLSDRKTLSEQTLAQQAAAGLQAYAKRLETQNLPPAAIPPARYAMAVLIDETVRNLPAIHTSPWLAAAHIHLFDRRDITMDSLHRFSATAAAQGPDYETLHRFLDGLIDEIEGNRQRQAAPSRTPARVFALACLAYLLSLAAYTAYLDYRYHADLFDSFSARVETLPPTPGPDRLAALAQLYQETERASASAPLSRLVTLPFWISGEKAEALYRAETTATLPNALREAMGEAMATEGDSLALYDTLRAWAILTGRTEWAPAFLAGWIESRTERLGLGNLARHLPYLDGPEPRLAVPDQALFEQARSFATETSDADRALLELTRLPQIRALGAWQPARHISEINDVFIFRSGRKLETGVPHLFTRKGWELTRDSALEEAIRIARIEAAKLFPNPGVASLDLRREIFDKLQTMTVQHWQAWLEDLRVRPFTDSRKAITVSGALARQNSALKQVIETVWQEAGGDDATRPTANTARIEAVLGPSLIYVRSPDFARMTALFSALNVALTTLDQDESRGIDALMGLQDRAQAGAVLKSAPSLVAQIAEDVFAQTSATHANVLTNPLTREWQTRVYPACQQAIEGRYPFHPGTDTDLASFDAFFAPGGALSRFYTLYAERNLDTSGEIWRWSSDVRLSGVTPESAAFLQQAVAISQMFYEENQGFGTSLSMAPMAALGQVQVSLGGVETALGAEGVSAIWPGPAPLQGMAVTFSQAGNLAQIEEPGLWGFLRLLDQTHIRSRDGGRRQLVDLRLDGGRVFFELTFPSPLNPLAAKRFLNEISCPAVL